MNYSRVNYRTLKKHTNKKWLAALLIAVVTLVFSSATVNTDSHISASKLKEVSTKSLAKKTNLETPSQLTTKMASLIANQVSQEVANANQEKQTTEEITETTQETAEDTSVETESVTGTDTGYTEVQVISESATTAPASSSYPQTLSNGNTAGAVGSDAAAKMAAATGVSQETWEYIIARESNGNPNAANPSGASGLFQTMPGWGSTATVDDQINSAIKAYNAQGLSAWGMQ